jgi:hypothetical protein
MRKSTERTRTPLRRRRPWALALTALASLLVAVAARAAGEPPTPPSNDYSSGKTALMFGIPATTSTLLAGTGTGDPLTIAGEGTCAGDVMGKSVWYFLTGDGYRVTLSTRGSNFDTLLSVYGGSRGVRDFLACNNDASPTDRTSIVSFDSLKDHLYNIEVGGFDAGGPAPPAPAAGQLTITATTTKPPPAQRLAAKARMRAFVASDGLQVRDLRVFAPHDSRVSVTCRPNRCRSFVRVSAHGTGAKRQRITVRSLAGKQLRAGTHVRILVTRPGAIGTYIGITIGRDDFVQSDELCLSPGSVKPRPCD